MIVYLINDIYNRKKEVVIKKNSIRPSYSNEFWNYNQGKNKEEEYIIKDRYNIYEKFNLISNDVVMDNSNGNEIVMRRKQYYELGKINIPIEVFIKLADYYDVSVDYLLGRTSKKNFKP